MASTDCMFHDDRDRFDAAQLGLQKAKWLPRKYAHRLGMAVCACRKNKGAPPAKEELRSMRETLYPLMDDSGLSSETSMFVRDCLNTAGENDYSRLQFLKVLVQAKQGDFDMLTREAISTNKSVSQREMLRAINRGRKPTAQEKAIIERKRMKKLKTQNSSVVVLPMYPGNLRLMETHLGGKVQVYSKKNNGYVELQNTLNRGSLDSKTPKTYIKIWGNPENITTLSERLIQTARKAQMIMDERKQERQRRRKEYRVYESEGDDYYDLWTDWSSAYVKDDLQDDFTLKTQKAAKSHGQRAKVSSSVLDGGHCYQCYKPFTGLKDTSLCTFHQGYVVTDQHTSEQIWNCCSVKAQSGLDTFTEHNTHGCTQSVKHNWRPHAKAKGKDLNKHADLKDI